MSFEAKNLQMYSILIILKIWPEGFICPFTRDIFKHVYWYIQQIAGERLQDHWSSGIYDHLGSLKLALVHFEALDPSKTVMYAWKISSDRPKQQKPGRA